MLHLLHTALFPAASREGSNIRRLLTGLTQEGERISDQIKDLIRQSVPTSADPGGTLEIFETMFDLPDECSPELASTTEIRRAEVLIKMNQSSEGTIQDFLNVLEALGYETTGVRSGGFSAGSRIPLRLPFRLQQAIADFTIHVTVTTRGDESDAILRCRLEEILPTWAVLVLTINP